MRVRSSPVLCVALAAAAVVAGCARYRAAPLDVERPLRAPAAPVPTAPWTYDVAVRYAVEHNPDLLALRARVAAVNVNPAREPVDTGGGVDMDGRWSVDVSFDALSLLGLGTRPYDVALACARRDEATLEHHARAREIAGEIAETFVVERALSALPEPDFHVDVSAFVRAGLESGAADTASAATSANGEAEKSAREAERRANRYVFARLLGLPPGVEPKLAPVAVDWPAVPEPTPSALVAARADVQRKVAAFETADRDLRRAVRAQYPSIMIEPGVAFDPTSVFGAVRLKLPVGMAPEVRALESAREAARADVESAVLDAVRDAGEARVRWGATGPALSAARKRVDSSAALLQGSPGAARGRFGLADRDRDVGGRGRRRRGRAAHGGARGGEGPRPRRARRRLAGPAALTLAVAPKRPRRPPESRTPARPTA